MNALWEGFSCIVDLIEDAEAGKQAAFDLGEHAAGLAIIPAQIVDECVSTSRESQELMARSRAGDPPGKLEMASRTLSRLMP